MCVCLVGSETSAIQVTSDTVAKKHLSASDCYSRHNIFWAECQHVFLKPVPRDSLERAVSRVVTVSIVRVATM